SPLRGRGCPAPNPPPPGPPPPAPPPPAAPSAAPAAPAPAPAEIRGINPADLDRSASACANLNQFGNGGWLKSNPIPADQSYWGSFSILFEENRNKLRAVLEKAAANPAAAGTDERRIGVFGGSARREPRTDAPGIQPRQPEFDAIQKIPTLADLQAEIARLQSFANVVFRFTAEQDRRKSTEVIAIASQGGLGLPDGEYY